MSDQPAARSPSRFADKVRARSRRCVLAPDGLVWELRRVNSADLAEHTVAELVGAMSAQQEMEALKKERKAEIDAFKLDHTPEDQREEAKEKMAAREAYATRLAQEAALRAFTKSPKMAEMQLRRINAYVVAGVVAGGDYKGPPLEPNYPDAKPDRYVGPVPLERCDVVPVRIVSEKAAESEEALWVGDMDEETRGWLCGQVSAFSGSPTLAPFRGEAGPADPTGPAGA